MDKIKTLSKEEKSEIHKWFNKIDKLVADKKKSIESKQKIKE